VSDAQPAPELLITAARPGEFLASNPSTRTHALGNAAFVELLSGAVPASPIVARDASRSPWKDGLLGDPTGLDRTAILDGVKPLGADDALALARRLHLVIDNEAAYVEFLIGRRLNVIDRAHRGTIHQRVGEHVLLRLRRKSVDDWWIDQKFTADRREPLPGLYRDVQWRFAREYFTADRLDGRRVLDFGCGPGLFARLFASAGATVTGLDTNAGHLETARRLAAEDGLADRCRFEPLALPVQEGLAPLADERFDVIFLSDVLMFYFHPYDPELELDPVALLQALAALLAPGGRIEVLEPNGVFWQQPWLGTGARPFTVLTEYRHRHDGVTPTLEQLSRAAESAGLAITRVREPAAQAGFAAEFPPWWFFELRPVA
jgi:SAM-dependent methyltransferase